MQLSLPAKPKRSNQVPYREVSLFANYYKLSIGNPNGISKYVISLEPELPADSTKLLTSILKETKKSLQQIFPFYVSKGSSLYSTTY